MQSDGYEYISMYAFDIADKASLCILCSPNVA